MNNNSMGGLYVPSANPTFQVIISDPKEGPRNDAETIEKDNFSNSSSCLLYTSPSPRD